MLFIEGSIKMQSSRSLCSALLAALLTTSSTTSRTSKQSQARSTIPLSTLARSKISFTSASMEAEETEICSTICRWSSVRVSISSRIEFMPQMTFRGVRISCDMVAKNWLLYSLAALTLCSSVSRCIKRRRDVTSWANTMSPTTWELWFLRPLTASIRSTVTSSLLTMGICRSLMSSPLSALLKQASTLSLTSPWRKPRKLCPIASDALILVSSAIRAFHSLILRLRSVPKMGLFAPSIIWRSSCPTF
mmetsp:Transcript_22927/g.57944  ORF Transcript_22927/g.57944 Transcript_22927/m.57944 type:complete len:248 (+) Transcript_22927:516-1259(+)